MLSDIQLTNFKSARNLRVPLSGLTVLAGTNGSGKSTLLQCLAVLRQSYLYGSGQGLLLRGPIAQLGSGSDVLSEGARDESIDLLITENSHQFLWRCRVIPESDVLTFIEYPPNPCTFITAPEFQYLQADRIVPETLYPQ